MPPFRTHEAIGPHQMALQVTRVDRRDVRRNAVDFGPPVKTPAQTTPSAMERLHPRRNALDLGLPDPMWHPRPCGIPPAVLFGLPPLPPLPPHAPSLWEKHPYSFLGLTRLGSGNYPGLPTDPSHCAECKMDKLIESEYTKHTRRPFPVVCPQHMEPRDSEMDVPFIYEGESQPGVFLNDILHFKAKMMDPHHRLISHRYGNGIEFTLQIEGYLGVQDILYLNCRHRQITRFHLAWILAFSFYRLAAQTFRLEAKDLALVAFVSLENRSKWVAYARIIHRIEC
ncbi:hypothetical protein C8R45DRAFT_191301 [Mycena sanguinolenta]|nr:hypothetical protein C8R45DRAFT_191301 [Mycena sanguinolenta]